MIFSRSGRAGSAAVVIPDVIRAQWRRERSAYGRTKRPPLDGSRITSGMTGLACGLVISLLMAGFCSGPSHAATDAARPMLARALAALRGGNAHAAHAFAVQAVAADGRSALAHAVLARTALALGDGVTAEAELRRARDAGFSPDRLHQLAAHARLLQGDAKGALAEAKRAASRYWTYGLRIQSAALVAMGNPGAGAEILNEAARRDPRDSTTWTDIGKLCRAVGDSVCAIDAAARAVALDGNNTEALLLRGQLVRTQFGLSAALPWFAGALQRDPARVDVLIEQAATLGDLGQTRAMLTATRRALTLAPGDARGFYLLAVLAARADKPELARAMLAKGGDAIDAMPGALLLGATLDLDDGAYEQAANRLRNLVAIQPMNIRARQLLARALIGAGGAADALKVLGPVAARDDADSYTLTLYARALEAMGDRVAAARYFDRAVAPVRGGSANFSADDGVATLAADAARFDDGAPGTAIPLIRAMIDRGDRAGALARARAVAAANPGAAAAAVLLGDTAMTLGDPARAAEAFRHAASITFDEPTLLRLIEAYERAGRRGDAAQALALFLSQNPDNVAALRIAAHWQIAAGEHDAAIDTLEGLRARLGDRDAALLAELAYAYDGAGEPARATSYAAAAYALAPASPVASDAYGWALFGAGDAEGARALLIKAVALAPGAALPRWHLAQLRHRLEAAAH